MENTTSTDVEQLLLALTKNIKFSVRGNSRNGQVKTTLLTSMTDEQREQHLRQHPYGTYQTNRFWRHPHPARVMNEIIEQQQNGTYEHTASELASDIRKQLPERAVAASVSRVMKHLPQTADASEFYKRVASDYGEQVSREMLATALRSFIREHR